MYWAMNNFPSPRDVYELVRGMSPDKKMPPYEELELADKLPLIVQSAVAEACFKPEVTHERK